MKRVLYISYSQTGQLSRIVDEFAAPLAESDSVDLTRVLIKPVKPFPFPWPFWRFFDLFPECVYLDPCEIEPLEVEGEYDLIVIFYQVWFLSPSIPVTAFLKSEQAKKLIAGKPVITVIGCRNMWLMAQEKVKGFISELGGKLIDNVVLMDQGGTFVNFVTTPRWLLTGRKNAFWGIFPEAGISAQDIRQSIRFGRRLREALESGEEAAGETLFKEMKAVEVNAGIIASEKAGYRSFRIWGRLIRNIGKAGDIKRLPVVALYIAFLITLILTIVPVNVVLKKIVSLFVKDKSEKEKAYFEQPSGSGHSRFDDYLS